MSDDIDNFPVPVADGEVVIAVQSEGVLVGGDPSAVESYLTRLQETSGRLVEATGFDESLAQVTGLAAAVTSLFGNSGKFVQLHPDSMRALRDGQRIPGTDGFFRMMTRGTDGKFIDQLQWKPASLTPQRLMSVQMVAVQLALKSAIADVEDAVRRVEGKVEQVLQLAQANRAGNVLGTNTILNRKVAYLEKHGSLPDADWDAVASLGPALTVTIEQLRNHVTRVLKSLDPKLSAQARADKLHTAVNDSLIGESLSLLVVAEESLYKWQRLRLARVESTQPDHLPQVMQDARELLAHHLSEDGKLYRQAHQVIDEVAVTDRIDGWRLNVSKWLTEDRDTLAEDLDSFARARHSQVDDWRHIDAPGVRDAVDAALEIATPVARQALGVAGQGLANLKGFFGRREKEPVVDKSADDRYTGSTIPQERSSD